MSVNALAIWMLLKVILGFFVIFIFLPSRVISFEKESGSFLDKVFIALTHMVFTTIILVHCLVLLKIYEVISLVFAYIVIYIFAIRFKGSSWSDVGDFFGVKLAVKILEISEEGKGFVDKIYRRFTKWCIINIQKVKKGINDSFSHPLFILIPFTVLAVSAFIRLKHSLLHAAYAHIDSYLHLIWVKALGVNQLYYNGEIYPKGFHSVISALSKTIFVDPYWVTRYIGPLSGLLIVLSVYYFTLRVIKSHAAALISLVVSGLVTNSQFPAVVFRQQAALSQEFGLLFLLPGLYFLLLFFRLHKRCFLYLFAETFAIMLFVQSYVAIYLVAGVFFIIISTFISGQLKIKSLVNLALFSALSGIIAMLPIGLGLLSGNKLHESSIALFYESIPLNKAVGGILDLITTKILTGNIFLDIALLIIVLALIYAVIRRTETSSSFIFLAAYSFVLYILYRFPELFPEGSLPELIGRSRTGVFLSVFLPPLYACGFRIFNEGISTVIGSRMKAMKRNIVGVFSFIICLFIVAFYPPGVLYKGVEEYDAAAENYLEIKKTYPVFDWTIVAPHEQFAQVLGSGSHYQILRFIQNYTLEQAQSPDFEVPFPTHHIFFYTEKRPLHLERMITSDEANKYLEPEGEDPVIQYYKNPEQRAIVEAMMINWLEVYKKHHTDITVFYEDENMRIYHIYNKNADKYFTGD